MNKILFGLCIYFSAFWGTGKSSAIEQISTNKQINVEVTASYGITEEVLLKALDYYEEICSLEDINNIRRNLEMPLIDDCKQLSRNAN